MLILRSEHRTARDAEIWIRELMAKVSQAELRRWVERISVPRHFRANPDANEGVALWLAGLLKSWDYDVSFQGSLRNVVALPRDPQGPLLLVCAHYDSVPQTPGADDNGSAVAAMLGCAKALAGGHPQVGFVAFNCEEDGLLGSQDFVPAFAKDYGRSIRCAHVLEMVGYASHVPGSQAVPPKLPISIPTTGDFLGLLSNQHSRALLETTLQSAKDYCPEFPVLGLHTFLGIEKFFPVLQRSDHAPFWAAGLPALMWTDTSEFRNPHYHQPSDLPETLDYEFLATVTRLLIATVLTDIQNHP